jgi:hypothetical protein
MLPAMAFNLLMMVAFEVPGGKGWATICGSEALRTESHCGLCR